MNSNGLTPKQEATSAIKEAKKILIVTHSNPDGDAIGSLLALFQVLKKLGKDISLAVSGKVASEFRFLAGWQEIKDDFDGIKDFIISLTEDHAKVDKLSYKLEGRKLNIVISPKDGNFVPRDVGFSYGDYHFDLLIILDCQQYDVLGEIYTKNAEMFFKNKTLSIDHHSNNTFFANINWINNEASSTSEILVSLIEALESEQGKLMDENIATSLLAGIMTDTGLFQNPNTTSKSLTVAAQLIAAGGKRGLISKKIFHTKSYATLKIWGRILSRINSYPSMGIVWSHVSNKDINETGATSQSLTQALNELLSATEGAKVVFLFKEINGTVEVSLRTSNGLNAAEIAGHFGGGGHPRSGGYKIEGTLEEAKKMSLEYIQNLIQGTDKNPNPKIQEPQPEIQKKE